MKKYDVYYKHKGINRTKQMHANNSKEIHTLFTKDFGLEVVNIIENIELKNEVIYVDFVSKKRI